MSFPAVMNARLSLDSSLDSTTLRVRKASDSRCAHAITSTDHVHASEKSIVLSHVPTSSATETGLD